MLIVYASKTGNVKRFVGKTGLETVQISEELMVNEKCVLITYTTGFGAVPEEVSAFMKKNSKNVVGVVASGNRNWGDMFGASADKISKQYGMPVLMKFEMSGTNNDVELFKTIVREVSHTILQEAV
ncbi:MULTISPECIES: class Ib ribonucleoside-diphosphate reductase assembly flavoprotein NrdI [Bacillus cereus group]|uniref:Protein NrdI n=1 Tax=Bacillus cereus TaxID=1396 RepID=A0A9X6W1X3_BACCE|nr:MULTISPECIES: class Ib ribonucleoside-diphosphate reductase assembly flavoprotein NrdI [Bacillus cereus group]PFF51954.1 class Ib ribonucleoside-diphosphate reductase assembly flavoprotein NrdI [Bacillus cereus]PFQ37809.1 class Ib ribonucleoside-diphosphate reductase assembly flavoprotein NrdI [Bacillus cereus]PGB13209.1 class Ib ribonucleoside-diphosphate reductase assembly flavoprotein NrdI [Bacillus toyonensis]